MQLKLSASGEGNQPFWQILLAYLQSVPDWQELLRQHPELEAALYAWLAAKDRWKSAIGRGPGFARRQELGNWPKQDNNSCEKMGKKAAYLWQWWIPGPWPCVGGEDRVAGTVFLETDREKTGWQEPFSWRRGGGSQRLKGEDRVAGTVFLETRRGFAAIEEEGSPANGKRITRPSN
jgi:hypothetical protein